MNNRLLIGIIINILVIAIFLGAYLSSPATIENNALDFTNTASDDTNITLIKQETKGYVFINNGSDPYYNYWVGGVLLNLPSNLKGYDLKTIYYGENNEYLHENNGNIKWVAENSAKSDPNTIGYWQTQDPHNISKVEVIIINPLGEIVFNETVKYDMNKFDYSRLNHDNNTTK